MASLSFNITKLSMIKKLCKKILNMKFLGLYIIFIFWNLILINSATASVDKFNNSDYINQKHSIKRRLIVPGTLWCGVGNVAIQEDDIGQFHETDKCCRDRDLCGFKHIEVLLHFESKQDVANQLFGKPVCKCEREFYFCLRRANTILSRNLGRMYFSVIRPKCYTYDHPSIFCIKYQGILQRRCLKYHVDTNLMMRVELRDNPYFF